MKNWKKLGEGPIALALFSAFFAKFYLDNHQIAAQRPSPRVTRASADFQANSLRRFHFGFQHALADMLWIELLQKASHKPLSRDEVSWEYAQLNGVISLDHKFARAYPFGAAFLSVFRRDRLGAQLILEKWTRYDPYNWRTHYMLGYHYFFEQKKYEEASRSMLKAASLPNAPPWLTALGIRLISETGAYFSALQVATDLYPSISEEEGKYRLKKRIRSLRFTLVKSAWERALKKFPMNQGRKPASTEEIVPLVKAELSELQTAMQSIHIHPDLEDLFQEPFRFQYNPKLGKIDFNHHLDAKELTELEDTGIYRME
jgi:tetratricopeptide (TPR) repeat protein